MKTQYLSLVVLALSACGGGSESAPAAAPPADTALVAGEPNGGIWRVDQVINGRPVRGYALATEDGKVAAWGENKDSGCSVIGLGTFSVSGNKIAVEGRVDVVDVRFGESFFLAVSGVSSGRCYFWDGSETATFAGVGEIAKGASITVLTGSMTTSAGNIGVYSDSGIPAVASFDPLYKRPSSLAKLAGNWVGPTGIVTTIDANGTSNAYDPATGCAGHGQYSLIDSRYNAYNYAYTVSGCGGSGSGTGIATIDDTVSPAVLYVGGRAEAGTEAGSAVSVSKRQ